MTSATDAEMARGAVREVLNRYCVEADRGRLDGVVALFSDDAVYEFGDRSYAGHDGIRALFAESGARARTVQVQGPVLHCMTTAAIEVTDQDGGPAARAASYVTVMTAAGPDHWGRYTDELRQQDGRWVISRRTFRLAGAVPDGLGEALR